MEDDFFLTNLELRESTATGEQASGLSHSSMKGMVLLSVLELAARGEPRGAVTVLHDAGDWGDRYRELATSLAEDRWAVALPDLRGHGRTEGPRGHSNGLPEILRDVQEIQDHLAYRMPDEPKVLIGQGLGALYASVFALEKPDAVRALVLVAPFTDPPMEEPTGPGGLRGMFKKVGPDTTGPLGWRGDQLTRDPAQAKLWDSGEFRHDLVTVRSVQEARRAAKEYLPRIGELQIPVLVLVGDEDPFVDVAACAGLASDTLRVETMAGMRHHPLQESGSAEVLAAISQFLNGAFPS